MHGKISYLENTLAISERRDVSSRVLFVHGLSGKLFGDHVSDNSHHGGTSVVQLNIELAGFLFRIFNVGSEVSNSVVSVVLGGRHPCELNKGDETQDLGQTGGRDGEDSGDSSRDIRELQVVRRGNVSVEDDVVVVDNGTDNGSHGNTSVLALDSPTTFEGLGLGLEPSKRIIDTKRLSDTEFYICVLRIRIAKTNVRNLIRNDEENLDGIHERRGRTTNTFTLRGIGNLLKRTELGDLEAGGGLSLLGRGKGSRGGDD